MSTASTVTASKPRNSTLGNKLEIANNIYILVATRGDATLFSPDAFQEKDMVEMCVGLGKAHLEGVVWLWDT